MDGLEVLRASDPTEILAYRAVVEKALEARDRHDQRLAARIIEALGRSLR